MKTNILSLFVLASLLFAACATDNVEPGKQKQGQEIDTTKITAFSVNNEAPPIDPATPTTRTAGEYTGTGVKFYWTLEDVLYVNNTTAATPIVYSSHHSDIEDQYFASGKNRTPRATFWFYGDFTAPQYAVRYTGPGTYGFNERLVTIQNKQEQTKPNDAAKLGKYGDCGTGIAHQQDDGHYTFMIDHKASYITFLPYTTQGIISKTKIEKIRVYCPDQSICGSFKFDDNGIDLSSRPSVGHYKEYNSIELTLNNFPITPVASPDSNAAIMVIAPGTYSKFCVEYTLYDPQTRISGTITKEYSNVTFTAGKNKQISQDLQVPVFPGNEYYMWDAAVGQHYWKGYEWDGPNPQQPTVNNAQNNNYPKNNTDPRWYNEVAKGYSDPTQTAPFDVATRSCINAPNVNEAIWYVREGDPHWDENRLWATMGHLYTGGMWLKKQRVIAAENGKSISDLKESAIMAGSDKGIDYRTYGFGGCGASNISKDKLWNTDNYFFLALRGEYIANGFSGAGSSGNYWLSTPAPHKDGPNISAYCLIFYPITLFVTATTRNPGYIRWTAQ